MEDTKQRLLPVTVTSGYLDKDRISDLPHGLRIHITSFLPMKDIVRTTALSKQWLHDFYSISKVKFDEWNFIGVDNLSETFASFVDKTLSNHDGTSINKFVLRTKSVLVPTSHVDSWILDAIKFNVQELKLQIHKGIPLILPCSLFTSTFLVALKLYLELQILQVPNDIRLPNLKTLVLDHLTFPDETSTTNLFLSFPLLEDLGIICCKMNHIKRLTISQSKLKALTIFCCTGLAECKIRICSPALNSLEYVDSIPKEFILEQLPSIYEAEFRFHKQWLNDDGEGHHSIQTLKAVRNATKLILNEEFVKYLCGVPKLSENLLAPFPNLKHLSVGLRISNIQGMIFLLSAFPNLEEIEMAIIHEHTDTELYYPESVLDKLANALKLNRLRKVQISRFGGRQVELSFVKIVLENANVLEEMIIYTIEDMPKSTRCSWLDICDIVRSFSKVSANAVIRMYVTETWDDSDSSM